MRFLNGLLDGQVARGGRRAVLLSTIHSRSVIQRRLGLDRLPKGGLTVLGANPPGPSQDGGERDGYVQLQVPCTLESILASIWRASGTKGSYDLLIIDSLDQLSSRFPPDGVLEFFRILTARMAENGVTLLVLDRSSDLLSGPDPDLASLFELSLDLSRGGGEG
jgi:hypothetical protein